MNGNASKIAILTSRELDASDLYSWSLKLRESLFEVLNYLDCSIEGIDIISEIEEEIEKYDIILPVLTEDNIKISEVQKDLDVLMNNASKMDTEVLLLLKDPVFTVYSLKALELFVSVPLFFYNEPAKQYYSLSFSGESSEDEKIWLSLLDIGHEVKYTLRERTRKDNSENRKNIYLAITTPDQEYYRQNLKRELRHWGFNVLPNRFLPDDYTKFKEQVYNYLEDCSLAIHILGNQYGKQVNGSDKSMIEIQNDIVAEYIHEKHDSSNTLSSTFRFIWLNPNIQFFSEEQQNYIEKVKHDIDFLKGTEIIQTPLELFKTGIRAHAKYVLNSGSTKKAGETKVKNSIYLIAENYNLPWLNDLEKELSSHSFDVLKLEPNQSGNNMYSLHKKYLVESHAVLVFSYKGNMQWLNSKLSDILKAPGFGKKKPFLAKGLLISDAVNFKSSFINSDLTVMRIEETGFNSSVLEPFVSQIRKTEL